MKKGRLRCHPFAWTVCLPSVVIVGILMAVLQELIHILR